MNLGKEVVIKHVLQSIPDFFILFVGKVTKLTRNAWIFVFAGPLNFLAKKG